MKRHDLLAATGLLLVAMFTSTAIAADQPNPDAILKQMSKKLASAKHFSFKGSREISAAFAASRGMQAKSEIEVTVRRPNQVVGRSINRDGVRRLYFDGHNLTLFDEQENVYSTVPMKTSLDKLPVQLAGQYGFVPPLADFVISNPYQDFKLRAQSIAYAGTGMAGTPEVECHHLALSGTMADSELWIGVIDSLPRKMTAKVKGGFAAGTDLTIEFTEWNLKAPVEAQMFVFTPPKDSLLIPMMTAAEIEAAWNQK